MHTRCDDGRGVSNSRSEWDVYIDSVQKVLPLLSLWLICVHPRERTDSWVCVFGLVDDQQSIGLPLELVGWLKDDDW